MNASADIAVPSVEHVGVQTRALAPHRLVPRALIESAVGGIELSEKAAMLAGVDDWHIRGVDRLGLPDVRVTDCGHGITLGPDRASQATALPTGIGMASTWNPALLEEAGRVLGREARALGCTMLLGPMINLHRLPINGRSYETFSEDPWLAGLLGAAVIRGIQAEGVGACVKAVAANSQQRDQQVISSEVSELVLRELYLRNFQLAIEAGDPVAVMTSYNMINGVYPSEDPWLLREVIKGEWQFPGMVVSDWRAVHSFRAFAAGLDLEMPGPGKHLHTAGVRAAIDTGRIDGTDLDEPVARQLQFLLGYPLRGDDDSRVAGLDSTENRAVALRVAEESIVLLKNDAGLLPLDPVATQRILVVGPNAAHARLSGGGSASVTPFYSVSPLDGIREMTDAQVDYIEGCSLVGMMEPISERLFHREAGELRPGAQVEFFNAEDPRTPALTGVTPQIDFSWGWASPGPGVRRAGYTARFSGVIVPSATGLHRIGAVSQEGALRFELDGVTVLNTSADVVDLGPENFEDDFQATYHVEELDLTAGQEVSFVLDYTKKVARALVRMEWEEPGGRSRDALLAAARASDAVVFCGGLSNLVEGGGRDRAELGLPAVQEELITELAAANPRTVVALFNGGPLTLPWEDDVPAILEAWYPGQEGGRALARILFGESEPSGRLPDSIVRRANDVEALRHYPGEQGRSSFDEELFVGYRHLDARQIKPHFPFGFGLGYTTFEIGEPRLASATVSVSEPRLQVSVEVRNTGQRTGSEVVQVYLRRMNAATDRPVRELRAFQKIHLDAGETIAVRFELSTRAMEHWAPGGWRVEPGPYQILVGKNSRDLQTVPFEIVLDQADGPV